MRRLGRLKTCRYPDFVGITTEKVAAPTFVGVTTEKVAEGL